MYYGLPFHFPSLSQGPLLGSIHWAGLISFIICLPSLHPVKPLKMKYQDDHSLIYIPKAKGTPSTSSAPSSSTVTSLFGFLESTFLTAQ